MPAKECGGVRCRCKQNLLEITPVQEAFVSAVLDAVGEIEEWKRRPDYGKDKTKTWLCLACFPYADTLSSCLIGKSVAKKHAGGTLVFGVVTNVADVFHATRRREEAVKETLDRPVSEWEYIIQWPGEAPVRASTADVLEAAGWAAT